MVPFSERHPSKVAKSSALSRVRAESSENVEPTCRTREGKSWVRLFQFYWLAVDATDCSRSARSFASESDLGRNFADTFCGRARARSLPMLAGRDRFSLTVQK